MVASLEDMTFAGCALVGILPADLLEGREVILLNINRVHSPSVENGRKSKSEDLLFPEMVQYRKSGPLLSSIRPKQSCPGSLLHLQHYIGALRLYYYAISRRKVVKYTMQSAYDLDSLPYRPGRKDESSVSLAKEYSLMFGNMLQGSLRCYLDPSRTVALRHSIERRPHRCLSPQRRRAPSVSHAKRRSQQVSSKSSPVQGAPHRRTAEVAKSIHHHTLVQSQVCSPFFHKCSSTDLSKQLQAHASMTKHDDDGSVFTDEGYEHWPSSHSDMGQAPVPAQGYDSYNGRRGQVYVPPNMVNIPRVARPLNLPQPPVQGHRFHSYSAYAPGMQPPPGYPQMVPRFYAPLTPPQYVQSVWYDAGLNHAYQQQQQAQQQAQQHQPLYNHPPPAQDPEDVITYKPYAHGPTITAPMAWVGRTRAEVERDNIRIAAEERAYEQQRKFGPIGMADDQKCWVVEADESESIREYREIKGMEGEWHEDPRYKGAMFFVCAGAMGSHR
nr:hypothetical protein CFP56_30075 [Quercus suber]